VPLTLADLEKAEGPASELVLKEELEETGLKREFVLEVMNERLKVMREAIERGLKSDEPSVAGMVGWNAKTFWEAGHQGVRRLLFVP